MNDRTIRLRWHAGDETTLVTDERVRETVTRWNRVLFSSTIRWVEKTTTADLGAILWQIDEIDRVPPADILTLIDPYAKPSSAAEDKTDEDRIWAVLRILNELDESTVELLGSVLGPIRGLFVDVEDALNPDPDFHKEMDLAMDTAREALGHIECLEPFPLVP